METYKCARCGTVLQTVSSLRSSVEVRPCKCGGAYQMVDSQVGNIEAKVTRAQHHGDKPKA